MKKALALVALILIASAVVAYAYFKVREYTVTITEDEIRSRMDSTLPFTKTYLVIFEITLSDPRVDLVDGSDRINAGMDVTLEVRLHGQDPKTLRGSIDASSQLTYKPESAEFFLINPRVDSLSVDGIPEKHKAAAAAGISAVLEAYYGKYPVYSLDGTDLKQVVARMTLKSVTVHNENIQVTLGL